MNVICELEDFEKKFPLLTLEVCPYVITVLQLPERLFAEHMETYLAWLDGAEDITGSGLESSNSSVNSKEEELRRAISLSQRNARLSESYKKVRNKKRFGATTSRTTTTKMGATKSYGAKRAKISGNPSEWSDDSFEEKVAANIEQEKAWKKDLSRSNSSDVSVRLDYLLERLDRGEKLGKSEVEELTRMTLAADRRDHQARQHKQDVQAKMDERKEYNSPNGKVGGKRRLVRKKVARSRRARTRMDRSESDSPRSRGERSTPGSSASPRYSSHRKRRRKRLSTGSEEMIDRIEQKLAEIKYIMDKIIADPKLFKGTSKSTCKEAFKSLKTWINQQPQDFSNQSFKLGLKWAKKSKYVSAALTREYKLLKKLNLGFTINYIICMLIAIFKDNIKTRISAQTYLEGSEINIVKFM